MFLGKIIGNMPIIAIKADIVKIHRQFSKQILFQQKYLLMGHNMFLHSL
jgi:hypothetical protein